MTARASASDAERLQPCQLCGGCRRAGGMTINRYCYIQRARVLLLVHRHLPIHVLCQLESWIYGPVRVRHSLLR
jgi:hypothetical protein